ncbi:MAG: Eco57I restriction-modification methylase domain-containing protein [Armatimonadetes bacterium]|nr:Eco57I restriction-modification methylase domain-containing protein [Armatimonadota bacterium]
MTTAMEGIFAHIEQMRRETSRDMAAEHKAELGQFFTPAPIAQAMAAMLECREPVVSLLDAGAGAGALFAAAVTALCRRPESPRAIHVTAYEVDPGLMDCLFQTAALCRAECERAGVTFTAEISCADFLESAASLLGGSLFGPPASRLYHCAILNPPYRKIHTASRHRKWLRRIGVETSNLYTGFLAAAMRLLAPGGEMVAITPRSFCNGPYFKTFRQELLQTMTLRRLHVYDSRQEAFSKDDVLQENIIFRAVKGVQDAGNVVLSRSDGPRAPQVSVREAPYAQVVRPGDPEAFIHIAPEEQDRETARRIMRLPCALSDLGLEVSTGRVVDFRAREWLRPQPELGAAPLLYPTHLRDGGIRWPKANFKKPNALMVSEATQALLVPNENYVLVKRFSSKEQARRVSATVYEAGAAPGPAVGFENHLNYFHAHGCGLDLPLARGLAAFLNSTRVDAYFRQFSGHTQVNATDLRSLKYPTARQLRVLGQQAPRPLPQEELDVLIEVELRDTEVPVAEAPSHLIHFNGDQFLSPHQTKSHT